MAAELLAVSSCRKGIVAQPSRGRLMMQRITTRPSRFRQVFWSVFPFFQSLMVGIPVQLLMILTYIYWHKTFIRLDVQ